MPDQKIVDYIVSQLNLHVDKNKIRNDLLMNGSLPSEIDAAFSSLNTNPIIPPYPPTGSAPASSLTNPTPVITEQSGGSILKKIIVIVIIIILLGAISVGAYFGYNYFKGGQLTFGEAVMNTFESFSAGKITSGEISFVANFTAKDVGKNYSSLATDANSKQLMNSLQDVALNFTYSGIINKTTDGKVETSGDLSASIRNPTGGSLGMLSPQEATLKYKTFSDNIYVSVEKIPSITSMMIPQNIDVTKYLNQWFSIPTALTNQYSQAYTGSLSTSTLTANDKTEIKDLMDNSGAFIVTDKKAEKTDKGTAVTALYIKVDWDKLGDQIIKLNQESSLKKGVTFSKSSELEMKANIEKIKELPVSNAVFKVLIGNDGYVHGWTLSGDLLDKTNNKTGSFNVSYATDNLNKGFVIDRPANARSFMEVMTEINSLMNTSSAGKGSPRTVIKK